MIAPIMPLICLTVRRLPIAVRETNRSRPLDMMAKALEAEGIQLAHVIGAKAGHNYTADAKAEINRAD